MELVLWCMSCCWCELEIQTMDAYLFPRCNRTWCYSQPRKLDREDRQLLLQHLDLVLLVLKAKQLLFSCFPLLHNRCIQYKNNLWLQTFVCVQWCPFTNVMLIMAPKSDWMGSALQRYRWGPFPMIKGCFVWHHMYSFLKQIFLIEKKGSYAYISIAFV